MPSKIDNLEAESLDVAVEIEEAKPPRQVHHLVANDAVLDIGVVMDRIAAEFPPPPAPKPED